MSSVHQIPSISRPASRSKRRRHHPILDAAPSKSATATGREACAARVAADPAKPSTSLGVAAGWSMIGPQLIERGGVATADDLVTEVFGVLPSDPSFSAKRKIVYGWKAGRSPFGRPLWDRSALGHAMRGPVVGTDCAAAAPLSVGGR